MATAFAIGLSFIGPAASQDSDSSLGRELIDEFVNNVQTMAASFEQQLVDADENVVDVSSGTLEIQRPGRFRWTYLEPYEQILVADGLNVWSYDVDLEQATVKPQAEVLGSTPALLLGGTANVLDEFNYIGSFTENDTVWVRLEPKTTENGFTRVELGFNDRKLSRMVFSDNLGQSTLIVLFDVAFGIAIDADRFSLVLPSYVDVVGTPAEQAPAEH
jgi:outer membrane lipoprotein carrier protein